MNYPQSCTHCEESFDSMDSVADTAAMVRDHIKRKHPDRLEAEDV